MTKSLPTSLNEVVDELVKLAAKYQVEIHGHIRGKFKEAGFLVGAVKKVQKTNCDCGQPWEEGHRCENSLQVMATQKVTVEDKFK